MSAIASMFERADVPVISADSGGFITQINEQFGRAFGWNAVDLVGEPLTTIIPERFRDAHHMGFSRFLATGQPTLLEQPLSLWIRHKDGTEAQAEHYIVAERLDETWAFAAIIKPMPA
jgi:PAS domain S-box-containing protein